MTILPPEPRRHRLRDSGHQTMHLSKQYATAVAIRDGFLFALIVHAVLTVVCAPRRNR